MKYPKYTEYEKIYKRFFKRNPKSLIELTSFNKDDYALDICGGNARLTKLLTKKCNNVYYLDKEKDMIPKDLDKYGIKVYNQDIESFVKHNKYKFDKVFCQQGINYWFNTVNIKQFSNLFNKNGVFIFNTFNTKPSETPFNKEYEIDNKKYIEISYLVKNKVEHIQIMQGHKPHLTTFDWISKDEYFKKLSPYFDIDIIDENKTSIYICRRK